MANLNFKVIFDREGWLKAIRDKQQPVTDAAVAALKETASDAVTEGRSNIAASGRFSGAWVSGLKFSLQDAGLQSKATIFHSMGKAGVFEFGANIEGRPLLWIPTTPGAPPAGKSGKKLVSATIRGQPVLFDAGDPDRHKKPLYIGVPAIRIAKKWRITEIVEKHAAQITELFVKYFKDT
jgi:hypothetical protein